MDWSKLTDQVSRIKVKNVVDMLLFYGLWVLVLALIAGIFSKYEWLIIVLFSFAGFIFLIAGFGYVYFAIKNPDYLRSEDYHIRKQSIETLGDKDNYLPVNTQDIVSITNPYQKRLPESEGESENQ